MCIIGSIGTMAKRSQAFSTNFDILSTILTYVKKYKMENDTATQLLLEALVAIAPHTATTKPFSEHTIKSLWEELSYQRYKPSTYGNSWMKYLIDYDEGSRELVLRTAQYIIYQPEDSQKPVEGTSGTTKSQLSKKVCRCDTTQIVFTSHLFQMREELHYNLFKLVQLNDNNASIFVELFKTYICLFKKFKNQELEYSVPMLLKTEEWASKAQEKHHECFARTIVASYFTVLAVVYNNKELERYIDQVVTRRIEANQYSSQCLATIKLYANSFDKSAEASFSFEQLFTYELKLTSTYHFTQ